MRTITFEIEIDGEGDAILRFPEGPGQQQDAALAGDLTEQLGKALGKIKERHVGHHHHHDHAHRHLSQGGGAQ